MANKKNPSTEWHKISTNLRGRIVEDDSGTHFQLSMQIRKPDGRTPVVAKESQYSLMYANTGKDLTDIEGMVNWPLGIRVIVCERKTQMKTTNARSTNSDHALTPEMLEAIKTMQELKKAGLNLADLKALASANGEAN